MIKLSKRLSAIVDMVPEEAVSETVADIGTDHGFVPIELLIEHKISRALAMDVREGPLLRARKHIEEAGLSDSAIVRKSDGLSALSPDEVQGVIMTGMGGELMLRILKDGADVREGIDWWVFSPQSELSHFRHGLEDMGLCITRERMIKEDEKFYTLMLVRPGCMHYENETAYRYGGLLIEEASPVFMEFLKKEEERIDIALASLAATEKEKAQERRRELEEEKKEINFVYDRMQRSD